MITKFGDVNIQYSLYLGRHPVKLSRKLSPRQRVLKKMGYAFKSPAIRPVLGFYWPETNTLWLPWGWQGDIAAAVANIVGEGNVRLS